MYLSWHTEAKHTMFKDLVQYTVSSCGTRISCATHRPCVLPETNPQNIFQSQKLVNRIHGLRGTHDHVLCG